MEDTDLRAKARRLRENIAVALGSLVAILLSIYFFTYAWLVDKGLTGWLWFEILSAAAMLILLFRLKAVAGALARGWMRISPSWRALRGDPDPFGED